MSKKTEGVVEYIKTRKAGRGTAYSFVIDETWYSFGFQKPNFEVGDKIRFMYDTNDKGYHDVVEGKHKVVEKGVGVDKKKSGGSGGKTYNKNFPRGGAGKDDYWQKKEERDIQVTQPLIQLQNSANRATEIVAACITAGVLTLPKAKAKQLEAVEGFIDTLTESFFKKLRAAQVALEAGEEVYAADEEELSSTGADLENEDTPLNEVSDDDEFEDDEFESSESEDDAEWD